MSELAQRAAGSVRVRTDPGHARSWWHLDPGGLAVGALFAALSMTPSLLPRTWLFQGVVAGLTAAIGYGLGTLLRWWLGRTRWWRRLAGRLRAHLPRWAPRAAWFVLLVAVMAGLAWALVAGAGWQKDSNALVGLKVVPTSLWLLAGPLLLVVAALLLAVSRVLRKLSQALDRLLQRLRLPRQLARVVAASVVGLLVVTLLNDGLLQRALTGADQAFALSNDGDKDGVRRPEAAERSGSPASLISWKSLGREGRAFAAGGRDAAELTAVTGQAAREPIRVFAGLESADGAQGQVDVALADLERAGAFDRAVLVVATTTGSGWLDGAAVDSLELMYRGDTAFVATQYSYLPSWLSFLVDRTRADVHGRLLLDAVHARVDELPEATRPKLLVFGESLGSRGSEAAFSTLADLRVKIDGALWAGPPHSNSLWKGLVQRRDPGTPEVAPVYASGQVVRFAGDADQIEQPAGAPWDDPRVLYLQHASDPIVWWSPSLLLERPDWLVEPRGEDVSSSMSWYPVVTFWQVTLDLVNAKSVPERHGHNYGDDMLDGWVAVAAPPGWTSSDTTRAREVLHG